MVINSSYKIAILNTDALVVNTAAENLQKYFAKSGLSIEIINITEPGENQIILAYNGTSDTQSKLFSSNNLSVIDIPAEKDAFHLKKVGSNIIVAGSNPRGVLYGAYELEEHLSYTPDKEIDSFVAWRFKTRSGGLGYYWSGGDFLNEKYFEEKAEYLSRIGINMYCPVVDGSGVPTRISTFVKSTIFPFQNDPLETSITQLDKLSAACAKYGIDFYQWLTEPALPHLLGPTDQYPESARGLTELPSWMNPQPGWEKNLCINSKIVQDYLREQVHSFIKRFPNVKGFFLYNNDCDSYLCVPDWCDNCKKVVTSNPSSHCAWELLSKTVTIFTEAAHEIDENFRVMFLPTIHNGAQSDVINLLDNTKYTDIAVASDAFDHNPMVTKRVMNDSLERCLKKGKENDVIETFMYHQMTRSEALPQNFLYPVSLAESIQTFDKWGFDNVMDTTGPTPSTNNFNAIVMKYLLRDPSQDYLALIKKLCIDQLGEEAGELMYQASVKTGEALEVWKDSDYCPFRGSRNEASIGTIMNIMPQSILPSIKSYIESSYWVPNLHAEYFSNWYTTADSLWEATALLKEAVSKASSEQLVKHAYYTNDVLSAPTSKEYAELQYATTLLGAYYAKFRVNTYEAWKLLCQVDDFDKVSNAQNDGSEAFDKYVQLVKADRDLQQDFADIVSQLVSDGNYIVKTSKLTNMVSINVVDNALNKVSQYNDWLKAVGVE